LLDVLADNKKPILTIIFITCFIGAAISFMSRPIYRADSLLQIKENSQSMVEQLDSLSNFFETKTPVQAEIELIKSRMILGKTIKNLHLDIIAVPKFFPLIGEAAARWLQRLNGSD